MWETIKKEPLIKTIVVILLGVLAFGFAFNIMFGAGTTSADDGSMMNAGYSLSNTLENIIDILIKVVIIGLLLGVIVWIFRAITKQSGAGQNRFASLKDDPIIRNALIIIGAVIVLVFGLYMFSNMSSNMSYNFSYILTFLLRVIIFILILGLGYGIIMYLKENDKNVTTNKDIDTSAQGIILDCPDCKAKVKSNWKCCPYCGSDKAFENTTV